MNHLFGTDGIRGKADQYPFDSETVWIIGRALAVHFSEETGRSSNLIIGRDTRESGPRIEEALASGVAAAGGVCESAGVITTPGVAYLTGAGGFDAGIVISASHNPFQDNGLKVFMPSGKKLPRAVEEIIENEIARREMAGFSLAPVHSDRSEELQVDYLRHFEADFGGLDLSGRHIVADCANGAASHLAPRLFRKMGAKVTAINNRPDGRNINQDCGSLHLDKLQQAVTHSGADFGVAFDGDADRALFVDEKGDIVDGDATLWIMANSLHDSGKLENDTVVATVMSNIGLEIALGKKSISLIRANVGDKYVLEELIKTGSTIGGEQSGHIIFPDRSLVGDGIQTALFLLRALVDSVNVFSELTRGFETYPQVLVNVDVTRKLPFDLLPEVVAEKVLIESQLGGDGRLLLRYSGTENLARVMIEGTDQADIEEKAGRLANIIRTELA